MVGTIDVTKGKSKNYYNLLIREKAKPPNIIQKLQSNFHFNSDNLKQIFKLPHSIVVELINSILYTNTKLYKIGFRANDLCTFGDNQPESLTHLFYHCHALNSFGLNLNYIGALFRINEFVSAWKMCSWNFDGKCLPFTSIAELFYNYWKTLFVGLQEQTNPSNINGFRAKIIAKYETEEKISNKQFFKRKWILTPYLS